MEALKNVIAIITGIVGVATAILTFYAKYLDVQKQNAREAEAAGVMMAEARGEPAPISELPPRDLGAIERSRIAVRAPASALIGMGVLALFLELGGVVVGFVDQFITPITTDTEARQARQFPPGGGPPPNPDGTVPPAPIPRDSSLIVGMLLSIPLGMASAVAIWAGYGMLRLRSYWVSVAGSFAIMLGRGFCCGAGIPIGIWSLRVLYKPEVASSFR